MINLKDNEKIGYLMGWLRENYDQKYIDALIDESMKIENASEFSEETKEMIRDAEKQFGTFDGESVFEDNVGKNNVWKSIANKFRNSEKPAYTDILFEEITIEE